MVAFDKTGYTITINTGINPIEEWQELQSEILSVLAALDVASNGMTMPFRLLNLMQEMQPDLHMAMKMIKN